jgi:competence protein ComEC
MIRKKIILLLLLSLCGLFISNLFFYHYVHQQNVSLIQPMLSLQYGQEMDVDLKGEVLSPIKIDGNLIQFTLGVKSIDQVALAREERVIIRRYALIEKEIWEFNQLKRGDNWSGTATLKIPDPARNHGGFDYKNFLYQQNIHLVGTIINEKWENQHNKGVKGLLLRQLDHQKQRWINQTGKIFSDHTAPIVQAMTIGVYDELDRELVSRYQKLGLVHILAISGLHIGIILWSLYYLILKLPITREKALTTLFIFIPFYIYLSGANVSVIRAGLMGMIVLISMRFHLWKQSVVGLYITYILLLLWNPFYLFQAGFQLSFLVTYFLIVVYPHFSFLLQGLDNKWIIGFKQLVVISLIAQIISLPILLLHFYQFSPISFFLNLLLVPLYSFLFIPGAFLLTMISFMELQVENLGITIYEYILNWVHKGLDWASLLPYASINTGKPQMLWFFLYALVIIFILINSERKKLKWSYMGLFLIPVLIIGQTIFPHLDKEAHVMLLDVGQGEAIVIEAPFREEVVLIDLGGQVQFPTDDWKKRRKDFEVGRDILLPYLKYRGINKIDKIIITHGHYDHFSGIQGLLSEVKIEKMLRSPMAPKSAFEKEWTEKIQEQGIQIYTLARGDWWETEHTKFKVLFPRKEKGTLITAENVHDANVVLWSELHNTTFLWTGDIEGEGEIEIIKEYPNLTADVLKVAHHGSLTSTSADWLSQVKPKLTLISVGKNNRYGLPHPDIIKRIQSQKGIKVYRTDEKGGILIRVTTTKASVIPSLQREKE